MDKENRAAALDPPGGRDSNIARVSAGVMRLTLSCRSGCPHVGELFAVTRPGKVPNHIGFEIGELLCRAASERLPPEVGHAALRFAVIIARPSGDQWKS
jgi:hypothetical protein